MATKIVDIGTKESTVAIPTLTNAHGRRINAILYTGCAGNGKSTAGKLTERLLGSTNSGDHLIWIDVSKIIGWCMEQQTPLGAAVRSQLPSMLQGFLLRDEYLIPTFRAWFNEMLRVHPDLELLIITGLPRTPRQNELLQLFGKILVVCINASREISDESIKHRIKTAPAHQRSIPDAAYNNIQDVINQRWEEHCSLTRPAIAALNCIVLHLDRKDPLTERLYMTLDKLVQMDDDSPVERHIVDRALRRFNSETHPIHYRIQEIERDWRFHRHISNADVYGGVAETLRSFSRASAPDRLS